MGYDFDVLVIDISEGCGPADYEKVAASGIDGVIFRATEGTVFDRYAKAHWQGFASSGVPFGIYPWHNPSDNAQNNLKQADKVIEMIEWGGYIPKLGVWVDYETDYKGLTFNQMRQAIWKYIGRLDTYLGELVGIYTRSSWWYEQVANPQNGWTDIPRNRPGWFANWNGKNPPPSIPMDWDRRYGQAAATFWQYTNRGRVDGINAAVDYNAFNGARAEFNKRFNLATEPHPIPDPDPLPPPDVKRIEIVGLAAGEKLKIRAMPFGEIKAHTWNGVQFDVTGRAPDASGRDWYYVGPDLCVAGWYTKAV